MRIPYYVLETAYRYIHTIIRIPYYVSRYVYRYIHAIIRVSYHISEHVYHANAKCKIKLMRCYAKLSRGRVKPHGMAALQASTSPRLNHAIHECMTYPSHECNDQLTLLRI